MRRFLPVLLLALWLLAWGHITVANVLSGIALVVALFLVFPTSGRNRSRVRIHPIALGHLFGHLIAQLVVSNVLVTREIISRRSRVRTGVIAYRVRQPSDLAVTLIANILALTPGTMPVDVSHDPTTIYVHFLLLSDVEAARRTIGRLEELVVAAVDVQAAER